MALSKLLTTTAAALDRRFGWDRLPRPLGVITLVGLRTRLRQLNLHDTGTIESVRPRPDGDRHLRTRDARRQLQRPRGADDGHDRRPLRPQRPGRAHASRAAAGAARAEPSPRQPGAPDANEFKPATIVNVLAGAWLQFEVHDWFSHGKNVEEEPFELELAEDDDWPERPMRIQRTRRDASHPDDGSPPTYVTADSHWWDGSQIYGSDAAFASALRSKEGGKLRLDPDGQLPRDLESLVDLTGVAGNFWLGLALLHTLFTREHNAICDRLARGAPDWSDDELYDQARLVNAALMAKIHTVEWTPAIIAHPTTRYAHARQLVRDPRQAAREAQLERGARRDPGSPTDHHGVPYSLTEEFVAVYRMHPLLPDDFTFRSLETDEVLEERTFRELGAPAHPRAARRARVSPNAFYSLGIAHPGAITLHNYPRFLQHFERPDGTVMDLAATDILRVRERGVPRYNEFRRLFHLKPAASFEELTDNPEWAEELRAGLRRRRARRPDGRALRRAAAEGLRLQRHRLPHLHPDGVAPPQERPLLHDRLQRRDLHPGRARLDRGEHDDRRAAAALPRARAGAARSRERVRALDAGGRVRELAEGVHCLGGKKGGHVHAFLLDDGRRADARRHALRSRRRRCPRRDPAARPEPGRPEADRPHPRPPLAPRRARGAEAGDGRDGLAHAWEADIVAGERRAQPVGLKPTHPFRTYPFQVGIFLGRPKHAPCPIDESVSDGATRRPARGAPRAGPLAGHLGFHWAERGLLIAGDAIATWPRFEAGWPAFNLNLEQHRESLRRLAASTRRSSASATATRSVGRVRSRHRLIG